MEQNPQSYTFALQTLSGNMYKFFVKDCLHDKLYKDGILNIVDQSMNSDRTNILKSMKTPLFNSIKLLKDRYVENNILRKLSEEQRIIIISLFKDLSESSINLKQNDDEKSV